MLAGKPPVRPSGKRISKKRSDANAAVTTSGSQPEVEGKPKKQRVCTDRVDVDELLTKMEPLLKMDKGKVVWAWAMFSILWGGCLGECLDLSLCFPLIFEQNIPGFCY